MCDGIPVLWSDTLRRSLLREPGSAHAQNRSTASELDVKAANFVVYETVITEYETKKIHSNSATNDRLQSALRKILSISQKGSHLDVGCGPGNVLEATNANQFELKVGCDISLKALRLTKAKGFCVVLGDAERLPFADGVFDLVTAYSLLHHLYDPACFMSDAFRVLRNSGGLVTDFDPNKLSAAYGAAALGLFRARRYLYYLLPGARKTRFGCDPLLEQSNELAEFHNAPGLGFDPDRLKQQLTNTGFEVVHLCLHNTLEPSIRTGRYCRPRLSNFVAQVLSCRNPMLRRYADAVLTASRKPTVR